MTLSGVEAEVVVGRGPIGTVTRAWSRGLGRVVAVKRVPLAGSAALARLVEHEVSAVASIDHPNLLAVLDVQPDEDGVAIVTELAPGGSLADVLACRPSRPGSDEIIDMATGIADALAAVHARGLVHGDVKPSNILFESGGRALLSDFGLARCLAPAPVWGGAAVGTAEYLDPAVLGRGPPAWLDERSDVYALGVVCYQALAGACPFTAPTPSGVIRAARRGRPRPRGLAEGEIASDIPEQLVAVVQAAMARTPEDRPAASELALALRTGVVREAGVSLRPGHLHVARPGRSRRGGVANRSRRGGVAALGLAVGLVAALVAGGVVAAARLGRPDRPRRAGGACVAEVPLPSAAAPGATVLHADLRGDGCLSAVVWLDGRAELRLGPGQPIARFRMGEPGDVLLLGDWDCSGRSHPGLYRASTGEAFTFLDWAAPGTSLSSSQSSDTGVREGRASVVRLAARGRPRRCATVRVEPAGTG